MTIVILVIIIVNMLQKTNLASAQEIAKRFGISYQLVNYYTNIGIFCVFTSKGNQRLYDLDQTVRVFKKVQDLRRQGYPLRLIRQQLEKE